MALCLTGEEPAMPPTIDHSADNLPSTSCLLFTTIIVHRGGVKTCEGMLCEEEEEEETAYDYDLQLMSHLRAHAWQRSRGEPRTQLA